MQNRKSSYPKWARALATSALWVALGACSTQTPTATNPSSVSPTNAVTSSGETASPTRFESTRHAYSVIVPAGWEVTEYEGKWTRLDQFSPGAEVPGEDVIAPPDLAAFLVTDSMAIPPGMSSQEWLAAFDRLVEPGLPQGCATTIERGVFAGESATVVEQRCDDAVIVGRSLTHDGRGYYFTILFPTGDRAAEAALDEMVASIEFTDG